MSLNEGNLIIDLSDDDEDNVDRTIQLQKSLISESEALINNQIERVECDGVPQEDVEELDNQESPPLTAKDDESSYRNALAANVEYDNYLARLESNLKALISECKSNLEELARVRDSNQRENKKTSLLGKKNHIYIYGAPFFKDKSYFPCPPNPDTALKLQRNELCWFDLPAVRWWSPEHSKLLVEAIKKFSKEACQKDAQAEKNVFIRKLNAVVETEKILGEQLKILEDDIEKLGDEDKKLEEEKKELEGQIKDLEDEKQKLEKEIENFSVDDFVSNHLNDKIASMDHDWLKLSASVLNGKHTADECRGFWSNFLHPKFYKGNWSAEERLRLRGLAEENEHQNWDHIAEQLGTNRSGYQCFAQYQNQIIEQTKQKWSDTEDEQLKALVEKFRVGDYIPWGQVTIHMKNRTKTQVYNRWSYSLNPKIKKGRFTVQEDVIILRGVQKWGEDFQKIASYMPDRTAPQIRVRFHSGISKSDFSPWTLDEDKVVLDMVGKIGNNWIQIAKHLPGKHANKVRHRYATLSKWIQQNPGKPLKEISSRRNLKPNLYNGCPELWDYAEKLLSSGNPKAITTSLLQSKPNTGRPRGKKRSLVDEKLNEYFSGTFPRTVSVNGKFTSSLELDPKLIKDVTSFLDLLGAKLDIPCDEALDDNPSLETEDRRMLQGIRDRKFMDDTPLSPIEHVNVNDLQPFSAPPRFVPHIDYVQPSDSSHTISLPHTMTSPAPWIPYLKPECQHLTEEEVTHPLFGKLKYLCPPNWSTMVGLRSILLGKRKLVDSVADYSTDPVLCDIDETSDEAFQRARQLWDDRLMFLFALPNLLSKMKPPALPNIVMRPSTSGFGLAPLRGVSPDSDCMEIDPGPSTSRQVDDAVPTVVRDGSVHVVTQGKGSKRGPRKSPKAPPKKRAKNQ